MKTIGVIGGMSWESTVTYYQSINRLVNQRMGGLHSAKCLISSVDFHEIEIMQSENQWELAGVELGKEARKLETAGADFIVLATNTMHEVARSIEDNITVPFLHIVDAVAEEARENHISRIGLLGTKYTLQMDFFRNRLTANEIETILPNESQIDEINRIIFEELVHGKLKDSSKAYFLEVMERLQQNGAEAMVLGCTEIGLLVKNDDVNFPLLDTAMIHAKKAVDFAIE